MNINEWDKHSFNKEVEEENILFSVKFGVWLQFQGSPVTDKEQLECLV